MIVNDHPVEQGMMYLLLTDAELRKLGQILKNPRKRKVSKEAREFGRELWSLILAEAS